MDENKAEVGQPETKKQPAELRMPIVGIGASAGGIEALQRMFAAVEPDCGMAFVVIQHLHPQYKSILPDMLARTTRLTVRAIEDGMTAEPNVLYVIPPNVALTIEDHRLRLTTPTEPRGARTPVDTFFISLAREQEESAAGVILSGTGSDGTQGLRAIKEHGGLTLAQSDAEYDGMMRSAVAAGMVDYVLPADAIVGKLVDYFRHITQVETKKGPEGVRQEAVDYLGQICALLRARTGHDFKDYKERTMGRRVQRRMQVLQIDDVATYVERLRQEPKEVDLLFQDLLIGVTSFFRDPPAFEALARQVIPHLFEGKGPDETVRVWVPGCATGEEAYSIGMLLFEAMPKSYGAPKLQIFASDIDQQALELARAGRYPASIAKDVPQELLQKYFVREDGIFRVAATLREICLFSQHNLLREPPFSRLDLISCRNLLIYFNIELQDRVIPLFHYALRENGYLFLGTSENVTRHEQLFGVVDKVHRIYQARPFVERRLPEFPLTALEVGRPLVGLPPRPARLADGVQAAAERRLLERYAPAYVVVNADNQMLLASTRTGRFLELPAGVPDHNILNLARRGLRLELRAALHRAASTAEVAVRKNVIIGTNGGQQTLDLIVEPLRLPGATESLYMVVFKEIGGIKPAPEEEAEHGAEDVESANVAQLEAELRATRERLQSTTEELEAANEDLKSSNEELSSMNEELQSANEELETGREELQSINEELQTVNAELNARVEELSRAHSDVQNLLESTQIATVFLDRDLCVKTFTPAAKDVYRLIDSDIGRPITDVRARFQPEAIKEDAERVLRTLAAVDRQVRGSDDRGDARYLMRILPYRTVENVINGVVLTFSDVTRITAAEARITELTHLLRDRIENLEAVLDLIPIGIFIIEDREGLKMLANRRGAQLIGENPDQREVGPVAPRLRLRLDGKDVAPEQHPLLLTSSRGEAREAIEAELLRPDGSMIDVMISAAPLFNEAGEARGAIAAVVDLSEISRIKAGEARERLLRHELQHRVKNILASVTALASRMLKDNPPPEEFKAGFLGRLQTMGRMHDLLTQGNWQGADLRALTLAVLTPFCPPGRADAATVEGPPVQLRPEPSATMGMVLHELATNAAKYGALSVPQGRVTVTWRTEAGPAGDTLVLRWVSQDGPPVSQPEKEGFGLGFVRRSVEYELAGSVETVFDVKGLQVTITFPLDRGVPEGGSAR